MIDFLKIELKQTGIVERLRKCHDLTFESRLTKNKNLVWFAKFKNMLFEIFEPSMKVEVSGSLHYLFNDGLHNWNDFQRLDLFDTVTDFCRMFGIEPQKAVLHGFEFGVNIQVPFEPSCFIERILGYKCGKIERLTNKAQKQDAIKIQFSQYRLKIYNKSKQFATDTNVLRFEVKITRMAKVWGITELKNLHDLLKPEILQKLGRILLSEFNELIISEPMQTERMTVKERTTFEKMNNRMFWESISNKSKRRDSKKRFRGLLNNYGNGLHNEVLMSVSEKWCELLVWKGVEGESKVRTFLQGGVLPQTPNNCDLTEPFENTKYAPFYHLNNNKERIHA